ncbi:methionine-synthesizing 5- methyltetrahydropteroyltriglutamate--homocysteine methyltransferase, partial [Phlyctochytrium planicorne]
MVISTNLGFPRMGANRDLKKLIESHWSQKLPLKSLLSASSALRESHWKLQASSGITHIPSNDFSLYDHVLDHMVMLDAIPMRYRGLEFPEETYFAMGRGLQKSGEGGGVDVVAMEMKKWFDTN